MNKKYYSFQVTITQQRWKLFPWTAFSVIHSCWWMNVDVIIKKRRTAGDVTQIMTTLKLKYPLTLTEKQFWRNGLEYLLTKCWSLRIVWWKDLNIIMRKYKILWLKKMPHLIKQYGHFQSKFTWSKACTGSEICKHAPLDVYYESITLIYSNTVGIC
jgi:hypothetical protein